VPDPSFAQRERRSFLVPILLALAALGLAAAIAIHFFPATTVNVDHVETSVLSTDTVFQGSTIVGLNKTEHVFFVASTIRVDNQLRQPIFLDNFHLTFTNPDDAELVVDAAAQSDLPQVELNFPALKPLLANPLLRNATIDSGKAAQGTLLFSLTISESMWKARKSAVIKVDLYHQPSIYVTIPKT
jgi:hypothetical protein